MFEIPPLCNNKVNPLTVFLPDEIILAYSLLPIRYKLTLYVIVANPLNGFSFGKISCLNSSATGTFVGVLLSLIVSDLLLSLLGTCCTGPFTPSPGVPSTLPFALSVSSTLGEFAFVAVTGTGLSKSEEDNGILALLRASSCVCGPINGVCILALSTLAALSCSTIADAELTAPVGFPSASPFSLSFK